MISSLLLLALLQPTQRASADPCASVKPATTLRAVVLAVPPTGRDSVVRATVCVVPPSGAAPKIGSYHGELHFDSTVVATVAVEKPAGGVRVENTTRTGQVNFAGAAPTGFPGRGLVTVVLTLRRPGAAPALRLLMKELNATDGKSLMKQLVVAGGTP